MIKHNYKITFTTGFELTLLLNQYDRKLLIQRFKVRAIKRLHDEDLEEGGAKA